MIRMKNILLLFLLAPLVFSNCSSFIKKGDLATLQDLEKETWQMVKDVETGDLSLKKEKRVRLRIINKKDWVKVYAYPVDDDPLKTKLVLLLFLFEDDFPKKGKQSVFTIDFFRQKLSELAVVPTTPAPAEKTKKKG